MSEIVMLKTFKYVSKATWRVPNAKEWQNTLTTSNFEIKSMENVFEDYPNLKWHTTITRRGDNLIFSVNLTRVLMKSEKNFKFEYKVSALLCRGKNRAYWLYWQSEQKEKLREFGVFSKDLGNISSIKRYLDGNDFEVRVSVELYKTVLVSEIDEPVCESDSQQNVIDRLKKILLTGEFSDVTVIVGEKKYNLHKAILSARSPFFADYFHANPDSTTFTENVDISCDAFDTFVKFVYSAECDNNDNIEDLLKIFALSEKYHVKDLKQIYECKLETRVTRNNAIDMFCHALKNNSEYGLKHRAFELIQQEYKEMGINIPSKLYDKSIKDIQEYIDSEVRMLELDLQELATIEE